MFSPSAMTAEISPMFRMANEVFHDPVNRALLVVPSSMNSAASTANRMGARQELVASA
jgi:hypothetical protein